MANQISFKTLVPSYANDLDLNEWSDDYPEIVELFSIGKTELGKKIWMLQILMEWGACSDGPGDIDDCEHYKSNENAKKLST